MVLAGIRCVVIPQGLTRTSDFSKACAIVSDIGEFKVLAVKMIENDRGGPVKISFATLGYPDWSLVDICSRGGDYDGADFRGLQETIDITHSSMPRR